MLYSCSHVATVDVKGLIVRILSQSTMNLTVTLLPLLKLKLKIKFVKRHKNHTQRIDTEALVTLQLTTGFESYSKQMCLESATKNRQTARFDD